MRKLLNQGRSTASPTKGVSGLTEHAGIMVLVAIVLMGGNTSTKGENQLMRVTIGRPGMTRFFYVWSYGSLKKTLTLKCSGTGAKSGMDRTVSKSDKRIIKCDDLPGAKPAKAPAKKPANRKKKPARVSKPKMAVSPSDLKARELNERLNAFPVWQNYQPLAIGIDKDIFRLVNDECFPGASKKVVQKLLRMHTGHSRYLEALAKGGERYHLDGAADGVVDSYQIELAAERLNSRKQ